MKLFGISNRGLAVIGILVLVLWGLILAERAVIRQARQDHYEFLLLHPNTPAALQPKPAVHPADAAPGIPSESLSQIGPSSPNPV